MPSYLRTTAKQAEAEFLAAGFKLVSTLPKLVHTRLGVASQCTTCEGPRSVSLYLVRTGVVCAHRGAVSVRYAEMAVREAGLEPGGTYPGRASRKWRLVCADCRTGHVLNLSRVRGGWRCPCVAEDDTDQTEAFVKEMRAAGYEPEGDYPGTARAGWPSVCTGCGQLRRPSLDSVRGGKRCRHSVARDLVQGVRAAVTDRIADGTYALDVRIPTGPDLAIEFEVSVCTVWEALDPLKRSGLLYSRWDKDGTRIHPEALSRLKSAAPTTF